jgi:hypothetical protein
MVEVHLELSRLQNDRYEISASAESMRSAYELALRREGPESHMTLNSALEWGTLFLNNGEYQRIAQSLAVAVAVPAAERRLAGGDRTWLPLLVVASAAAAQALVDLGRADEARGLAQQAGAAGQAAAISSPEISYWPAIWSVPRRSSACRRPQLTRLKITRTTSNFLSSRSAPPTAGEKPFSEVPMAGSVPVQCAT